jgi:hypothetical protein
MLTSSLYDIFPSFWKMLILIKCNKNRVFWLWSMIKNLNILFLMLVQANIQYLKTFSNKIEIVNQFQNKNIFNLYELKILLNCSDYMVSSYIKVNYHNDIIYILLNKELYPEQNFSFNTLNNNSNYFFEVLI